MVPLSHAGNDKEQVSSSHMKERHKHRMSSPAEMRKRILKWMPKAETVVGTKIDPNLVFLDQDGKKRKIGEFFDKPFFITFMFASCPHVCPAINANMAIAADKARKKGLPDFRMLSISFDNENDDVETMKQYGEGLTDDFTKWPFGITLKGEEKEFSEPFGFSFMHHRTELWAHISLVTAVAKGGIIAKQIYGTSVIPEQFADALKAMTGK